MTTRDPGETVGDLLKRLRREAAPAGHRKGQISQADAAEKAGVTREQWNRWENGGGIEPRNRDKIAAVFDVSAADLVSAPAEAAQTLAKRLEVLIAQGSSLADRLEALLPAAQAEGRDAESKRQLP